MEAWGQCGEISFELLFVGFDFVLRFSMMKMFFCVRACLRVALSLSVALRLSF